jgi:hypothetical protein
VFEGLLMAPPDYGLNRVEVVCETGDPVGEESIVIGHHEVSDATKIDRQSVVRTTDTN